MIDLILIAVSSQDHVSLPRTRVIMAFHQLLGNSSRRNASEESLLAVTVPVQSISEAIIIIIPTR